MCTLQIYSDVSSFKSFADDTELPVARVQIKGDLRRPTSDERFSRHRVTLRVSDKEWDDFPGQVQDAIQFLTGAEIELTRLIATHGVDLAYLDFPVYSRLDGNIINQNERLPPALIAVAGRIGLGVEIAVYERSAFDEIGDALEEGLSGSTAPQPH